MNLTMKNIENEIDEEAPSTDYEMGILNSRIAQFYVFKGEKYLGWDCFDKKRVTIGKSPDADLVLTDETISDIQATFTITADGILVSNEGGNGALSVNDKIVSNCIVNPLDLVKIGQYTIKVKLKKINDEAQIVTPVKSKPIEHKVKKEAASDNTTHTITAKKSRPVVEKTEKEVTLGIIPEDKNELEKTFKVAYVPGKKKATVENILSLEKTLEIKPKTKKTSTVSVKEIVRESIEKVFVNEVDENEQVEIPEVISTPVVKVNEPTENTFPESFFNPIDDLEDNEEDDDDFPANFSLKEKLIGSDRNVGRTMTSNKMFEIIKLRGDNVISVKHLSGKESHCIINQRNSFCKVERNENDSASLFFTEPLLNKINLTKNNKLETRKTKSLKSITQRQNTYKAYLPNKGETTVSDGFYDYVLRTTYVADKIDDTKPVDDTPLNKKILQSTAFRNATKAVIFHLVVLVVLSFTIEIPDIEEFKNPETHFVVIDTKNIHKPVKPKPKPIIRKKAVKVAKKKIKKPGTQVAALRKKPGKKVGKPKAGGGHKGNLVNRNVNQVGLLGALGLKTGIKVKSNAALAAVTNIDAITSTHSREAKIKIGGIVGSLGDGNIAIPTGGVFNSKGSTDVLRSAGIGGKGSIAALEAGNTGQRAVAGTVSAPLTKKVRFKGGGISREAVAKVINEHLDEISYCYETSLIGDPSLMGKVVFEWKILPSGKVGEVKIKSSTLRSNDIHSCIKSAIRTWRFPKPKGGAAVISYPFVFDVSGF